MSSDVEDAVEVAERVRRVVEYECSPERDASLSCQITVSLGIASLAADTQTLEQSPSKRRTGRCTAPKGRARIGYPSSGARELRVEPWLITPRNTPEYAYGKTLYLNNKYFLDGRDPNSYANVAWVFGQYDRGWKEREVFGKVRYMSAEGLERKARPEEYDEKVERSIEEDRAEGL